MKYVSSITATIFAILLATGCGKAIPLNPEGLLGDAVIGDGTGTRNELTGYLRPVVMFVPATGNGSIPGWTYTSGETALNDYPFQGPLIGFNDETNPSQAPFYFQYSYPTNNFALARGQLLIDTKRAQTTTDQEGFFLNGVFTGLPANNRVNELSPMILHPLHHTTTAGGTSENRYFVDMFIRHYVPGQQNTFDLEVAKLLDPAPITEEDVIKSEQVDIVLGPRSPVYQAYLAIHGFTFSMDALTCTTNSTAYTFQNAHNFQDGNSIGQAAFSGVVETPFQSTSSLEAGFKSIEFHYDASLPGVDEDTISLTNGSMEFVPNIAGGGISRNADPVAIVINGIGIAESSFDKAQATSVVEKWDTSTAATNYLSTFLATIPTDGTKVVASLDLLQLLGEAQLLALMKQGKLNVSFAGGFRVIDAENSSTVRVQGTPIFGPEFHIAGTYFVEECQIPDDPESPLSTGFLDGDTDTAPVISSISASDITSSSAVIVWLTNKKATSQVGYGVGSTDTLTTESSTLKTFHSVKLTGLSPYKYYYFKAISKDADGRETISATKLFRTLR